MTPEQLFECFAREPQIIRRVPVSTYRLPLDRTFTFGDTRDTAAYVPRFYARRPPDKLPFGAAYWPDDTHVVVPRALGERFRNVLTDERVASRAGVLTLADACASFPVALLAREG